MQTLKALKQAQRKLTGKVSQPLRESEKLLASVLKISPLKIYSIEKLKIEQKQKLFLKASKRAEGYPLDYILKEKYFFGRKFLIQPSVFIPRPESEKLVHLALKAKPLRGVDLGAGCGCLAISILLKITPCRFVAMDIGPAVKFLRKNRRLHGLTKRLKILNQDVFNLKKKDITSFLGESPDLVISNPPYIGAEDKNLAEDVKIFEPPLALFSTEGGMTHIYLWFEKAMSLLEKDGVYIFEFGFNQRDKVKDFLNKQKVKYSFHKDQLGHFRAAFCIKK